MNKLSDIFSYIKENIFTKSGSIKLFYYILVLFIFVLGIWLRLKNYLYTRSLWLDECFLFDNIYNKNFLDFFSKLYWGQSAPPLFLMLEKLVTNLFGIKEFALRLVPFVASIIALPVFYSFSKIYLNKPLSILFANFLFAINVQSIFYAQELKQYSTDLLCFMILYIFFKDLSVKTINNKSTFYYIIISTILPLFSLTSYFVIFGWIFSQVIECKKYLKKLVIIQIPAFLMSCFYYFSTLQVQQKEVLIYSPTDMWATHFLSANFIKNFSIIKDSIVYYFYTNNNYNFGIDVILINIMFLGMFLTVKNYQKRENSLAVFTLLVIVVLAFLKIYPIFERSVLFVMPLFIIFAVKVLDYVSVKRKILSFFIVIVTIFAFQNYNLSYIKNCIDCNIAYCRFHDKKYPNPQRIMQTLIKNYKSDDIVVVNHASIAEYIYYQKKYGFYPTNQVLFEYMRDFKQNLDELKDNEKYWFFYSNDYTEDAEIINDLKTWKNEYKVISEQTFPDSKSYLLYLQKTNSLK